MGGTLKFAHARTRGGGVPNCGTSDSISMVIPSTASNNGIPSDSIAPFGVLVLFASRPHQNLLGMLTVAPCAAQAFAYKALHNTECARGFRIC